MGLNDFGYTRWGRDWVRLAEPLNQTRPDPLLPRARRVAASDGLTLEVEGRVVRAHLHRGGEASVTHVEFAPLAREVVAAVATIIPGAATAVTDADHTALVAAGHSPAPTLANSDCSCSARTPRCLHVLATLYAVAQVVDNEPSKALSLQGYFEATPTANVAAAEPRWTAINTLDPAAFFG
ncbi:hypothetical protein [Nocardia camponoti]|uniref:SWIM-type domain-containing protein n=1 Tax=Nocardia camponoti TaxID=1616106 RepID=A0A917V5P6_9NOCA|nr:hypothetical protein [Nocardia camponoti]GGK41158.1 hypothetical protein GCM10011591_10890 [Nocardia camponoti]